MTKKARKKFTPEQKQKAVQEYVSGQRSAPQIAAELGCDVQNIYRWKTLQEEQNKGVRIEELMIEGNTQAMAEKLLEKELEIEMYQKKIAEQAIIVDLLKKIPNRGSLSTRERIDWVDKNFQKVGSKKKACEAIGISMSTY